MKKLLLFALLALPSIGGAQLVTNSLDVVLTTEQFNTLQVGWKVNNYERTNSGLPSVTFKVWGEGIASSALVARADQIQRERELKLLELFRAANDAKQIAILKEALKP